MYCLGGLMNIDNCMDLTPISNKYHISFSIL